MSVFKFTRSEMNELNESAARACIEAVRESRIEMTVEPEVRARADEQILRMAEKLSFELQRDLPSCIRRVIATHPNLALLSRAPVTRAYAAVRAAS
jgi:hypothetical protein